MQFKDDDLEEGFFRRAKTSLVKTVVPKPVRDIAAGVQLAGKAARARKRGFKQVGDRMLRKAGRWASGDRKEPDPDGQWNGNNSYHQQNEAHKYSSKNPIGSDGPVTDTDERLKNHLDILKKHARHKYRVRQGLRGRISRFEKDANKHRTEADRAANHLRSINRLQDDPETSETMRRELNKSHLKTSQDLADKTLRYVGNRTGMIKGKSRERDIERRIDNLSRRQSATRHYKDSLNWKQGADQDVKNSQFFGYNHPFNRGQRDYKTWADNQHSDAKARFQALYKSRQKSK